MSATFVDTENGFWEFVDAYEADCVTPDGKLVIDAPEVRRRLIKVIDSYTALYRKGCTPPDSVTWAAYNNNEQFLAQDHRDDAEHVALNPERPRGDAG